MAKRKRDAAGLDAHAVWGKTSVIGFDFDCTLTVRHFFKVFAMGYLKGNMLVHDHCAAFAAFCKARGIKPKLQAIPDGLWSGNAMGAALEDFSQANGEDAFRDVFREVFCGGEERIRIVADWLENARRCLGADHAVEFAIVTAGISSTVLRGLSVVPEWQPYFPLSRVWDTSQGRHKHGSVIAMKAFLLRDLCPDAAHVVLVDDSLSHDEPQKWTLDIARVEVFRGELPYEGSGLSASSLAQLETHIRRWSPPECDKELQNGRKEAKTAALPPPP
eukprot:TRINITY_DN12919_c0_g1_i1.p1 TRINITY_DN12919_c0_g1~~TRINITY_DN12919_c0_g1_i1.p1  ORF type:complete len:292 (-),score=27.06 TRINITY_DN12919_c0_g1_i1:255-1079(-)